MSESKAVQELLDSFEVGVFSRPKAPAEAVIAELAFVRKIADDSLIEIDDLKKQLAAVTAVLSEMVKMMDDGDESGAGSEWHKKAKAALKI